MKYYYEIYLNNKNISAEAWHNYLLALQKFIGIMHFWKIIIKLDYNKIRYYIESPIKLPITLNNMNFLLKEIEEIVINKGIFRGIYFNNVLDNVVSIYNNLQKKGKDYQEIVLYMRGYNKKNPFWQAIELKYKYKNKVYSKKLFFRVPINILQIDFNEAKSFCYTKFPKYMSLDKVIHLFRNDEVGSIMKVDTFPYLENNFFLNHNAFDFDKHSLVMGASGSGKSKFLALLINNIYKYNKEKYKVVFIDPHDALKDDLGEVQNQVIDFKDDRVIDLFKNNIMDINANVELLMSLFKSLINDSYNAKLERVLRNSIHLLLLGNRFSFKTLRKLILELEYRVECLKELEEVLPESIIDFFYNDFNELKTKSYMSAIAPILAFLDEVILLPGFQKEKIDTSLTEFLTIFSLDRTRLGDHMVRTIAGFLMQQILKIAEKEELNKKLVLVVDEVAVVENPVLTRILSEARKYNISLILIGQYLNQLSSSLLNAIFANTVNYYIFRSSRIDATTLVDHLNIDLKESKSKEDKIKLLTELNNRECIVRLSVKDKLQSSAKAHTLDFQSIPYNRKNAKVEQRKPRERETFSNTWTSSPISLRSILEKLSTNKRGTK